MDLERHLQDILDDSVSSGEELGVQLTVYRNGEELCNLASGWTTADHHRKMDRDTVVPVFSVGKGVITTLFHVLRQKGFVSPDDLVTKHWPEYGANGKEGTRVWHILTHRAGLWQFPDEYPFEDWFDFEKATAQLAKQSPADLIGGNHHYHAHTYGLLLGKILEDATRTPLRQLFQEELFGPLGMDRIFFGLPEAEYGNLAPIERGTADADDMRLRFFGPAVLGGLNPSSNGCSNARSLARLYASLIDPGLEGRRLLPQEIIDEATILRRCAGDPVPLGNWDKFGYGYALCGPLDDVGRMFGHGGACGAEGFADKKTGYAVGFTKQRLNRTHPDHATRNRISEALGLPLRIW